MNWAAFDQLKALLGDKPLVLDREFSYLELLEYLAAVHVNFVIRLHLGSHPPTVYDAAGRKVIGTVGLGEQAIYHQLHYMFILLKRKIALADERLQELHDQVVAAFAQLVQPLPVRT